MRARMTQPAFILMGLMAAIAMQATALERVAIQPSSPDGVRQAMRLMPICGTGQYLISANNRLECRDFPTCAPGESLTSDGAALSCVAASGNVSIMPLNDATTTSIGGGFNTTVFQVESQACPADYKLSGCSGGTMMYGSSTGTEFETEIIAPVVQPGNERCRMTYEIRNGSGLNLRELYAYCIGG